MASSRRADERLTAEEMDEQRRQNLAYQYLCRLEEAKRWMEACLKEELPSPVELEESLRNGVLLAKLGHCFAPSVVPVRKIYDVEQLRYQATGLHFRHTDNINFWLSAIAHIGLPSTFFPETTDIYDKKNMPRVIYCIHALSLFLFRLGLAPQIHDLYGKVKFTAEELSNIASELAKYGLQLPAFSKIGGILASELSVDEAAVHAAVLAINEAVERGVVEDTLAALQNPNALLGNLREPLAAIYQELLAQAKMEKAASARHHDDGGSPDIYDHYLTQAEIQGNINHVNVHGALEVVDDALERQSPEALLEALQDPALALRGVRRDFADWYLEQLSTDREQKAQELGQVELLEKEEVQAGVAAANMRGDQEQAMLQAVLRINRAIRRGVAADTVKELMCPEAQLPPVYPFASATYQQELAVLQQQQQGELGQEELFVAVEMLSAVALINRALEARDVSGFWNNLRSPAAGLAEVEGENAQRYFDALVELRQVRGADGAFLSWNDLQAAVSQVNAQAQEETDQILAVSLINEALDQGSPEKTLSALLLPAAGLDNVSLPVAPRYHLLLVAAKRRKAQVTGDPGAVLWLEEIRQGVVRANQDTDIAQRTDSFSKPSLAEPTLLLGEPPTELLLFTGVCPSGAPHLSISQGDFVSSLNPSSDRTGPMGGARGMTGCSLPMSLPVALGVAAINQAIKEGKAAQTERVLRNPAVALRGVVSGCADSYQQALEDAMAKKRHPGNTAFWVRHGMKDGAAYYFHLQTFQGTWEPPANCHLNASHLTREEIQSAVTKVTAAHDRQQLWKANVGFVIQLQARLRGFLVRQRFAERSHFLRTWLPAVLKIQSHWRGVGQRKAYLERLQCFKANLDAVIKIQAWVRMWAARRRYLRRLHYFQENVDSVVKIQAFFRARKARDDYRMLVHAPHPPLSVVRRFAHLLNQSQEDFMAEAELLRLQEEVVRKIRSNQQLEQDLNLMDIKIGLLVKNRITLQSQEDFMAEAELLRLQEEVVRKIRSNQQLEQDLNLMDIKIGLLVKNRITLQEVVSHCKKLTRKNKEQLSDMMVLDKHKGLKSLSKEKRQKLEAYQHLFYLLQTQPVYLAKLIFQMPQNKSTKFMEAVIFSLYNYASNRREAYLLLQLFKTALREEIQSKVEQPQDVVTGNPTVVRLVVRFYRNERGQSALREILGKVIQDVLEDKVLSVHTDPVHLYKSWVNQTEAQTGQRRSKVEQPQDVVTGNPTVVRLVVRFYRNERGQSALREILGKVIQDVLEDKVLSVHTDPVHLYKSWVNQTEAQTGQRSHLPYDVTPEQALSHPEVQRRLDISLRSLLAMTDKFLVAITSSVDQIPYGMRYVAKVLKTALTEKFPDAKESEVVGNLLYYRFLNPAVVAPDAFDIVAMAAGGALAAPQRHTLGAVAQLLQHAAAGKAFSGESQHLRVLNDYLEETHLKFRKFICRACQVPEPEERFAMNEYSDMVAVAKPVVYITVGELVNTHQLLLEHQDWIAPDHRDPLHELLEDLGELPAVADLVGESVAADGHVDLSKLEVSLTLTSKFEGLEADTDDTSARSLLLSTKQMLADILQCHPGDSLQEVLSLSASREQSLGLVSAHDGYQGLVDQLAKDIRSQRRHRQRRKAELRKLQATFQGLCSKTTFYEEQGDYYSQYIRACLDHLAPRSKNSGKGKKQPSLHYTAAQLLEKGVLVEIEDLPASHFRNVIFDITPGDEAGQFEVKARFLGVDMERFQLHYQDLLQLQYEGVAVMKLFSKAKVNVNLLIFLLNKKFLQK
ncbi:Ras GTPase-activating-like protein IQGAP3 [Tupaia chinensis]|uniref:Ras GTPase-activating-like protein IQGAP3 n=1 Tax=Tupaia chinensis TaxID=246437 RepID=L9KAY5_TUPCH|nr:Ras GTPase-activating-like protein IQGAP3 [Tupaia chinensis]